MAARCRTRWNPAVGFGSSARGVTRPSGRFRRIRQRLAQDSHINAAGVRARRWRPRLRQREQQVLQGRVFVLLFAAWPRARCRVFSRVWREQAPQSFSSVQLQRVIVSACEIDHLGHLCFGDLIGIDTTNPDAAAVDVQHDLRRLFPGFVKMLFNT